MMILAWKDRSCFHTGIDSSIPALELVRGDTVFAGDDITSVSRRDLVEAVTVGSDAGNGRSRERCACGGGRARGGDCG